MSSDHMDVITSLSAEEIRAYCRTLAQELELTLADVADVWWSYDLAPDHPEAPYHLVLSITKPLKTTPEFWFTREQVLGYTTGTTSGAIQSEIRQDLKARLRSMD
jgi:hypothetical protein